MATEQDDNGAETVTKAEEHYMQSYSHHMVHEELIRDTVRTETYRRSLEQNRHLVEGKIVLDIGCGTGVLSMFAARAGAAHVYAVDVADIADHAAAVVRENGLDGVITVIKGRMEEVELPVEAVDVIVSEWMGYCLLYEAMLDTVIYARDRYLREGGVMLPDKAALYLCAAEDAEYMREKIDFWDNVYGFKMSSLKEAALAEPLVDYVQSSAVFTGAVPVLTLDVLTCTAEDLSFTSEFTLTAQRNDFCHAFIAFFEVAFTQTHKPLYISTSPSNPQTHWKQTIFYLREPLTVCSGEEISGTISMHPNGRNRRDMDVDFTVRFEGRHMQVNNEQAFRIR